MVKTNSRGHKRNAQRRAPRQSVQNIDEESEQPRSSSNRSDSNQLNQNQNSVMRSPVARKRGVDNQSRKITIRKRQRVEEMPPVGADHDNLDYDESGLEPVDTAPEASSNDAQFDELDRMDFVQVTVDQEQEIDYPEEGEVVDDAPENGSDDVESVVDSEVVFKKRPEDSRDYEHFKKDPAFQEFIKKTVRQQIEEEKRMVKRSILPEPVVGRSGVPKTPQGRKGNQLLNKDSLIKCK